MMEVAKKIDWHPSFGLDRELDWLSNMHDWLISKKNRYWGLALPIYECQECGNVEVIGSKEELEKKAVEGWDAFTGHTPHKPYIDMVKILCSKCGAVVSRIDDVGNVWLDAGIIPFSTLVDPSTGKLSYTTDKKYWKEWFPANFITESFPGQFKNWFYSLIAMSTVLENTNPFKTLLGFATMVDEKGEPFHKSKGNAIEFVEGADTFGADVIRYVCAHHDITHNIQFGIHMADQTRRKFLTLWNVYNFFVLNATIDSWKPKNDKTQKLSILDEWILFRLNQTIEVTTESFEQYDAFSATDAIENFINDLSLWYVRRSRDRVGVSADDKEDKEATYHTLYTSLVAVTKLLAPVTPFLADEIYTNLTSEESVHLADWPSFSKVLKGQAPKNEKLIEEMMLVRKIVEVGLSKRKEASIKVRQPLAKFTVHGSEFAVKNEDLVQLIKDELNVKEVIFEKNDGELTGELDTTLTKELKEEGEAREIVRSIQDERKKLGTTLSEKVAVTLPSYPKAFEEYIKKQALITTLTQGDFKVERL